ncbi:MAG: amino acid ABC transporter substrate-binding protein [Microcystaceae cyanobacterium]
MSKLSLLPLVALMLVTVFPAKVGAETVLEKIARTGELNAGTRTDAIPFGYLDEKGKPDGYAVDLINLVQKQLEQKLNKKIKLNLKLVTIADRFKVVTNGSADIACGVATITTERLEKFDFSIPYFMSGAQFLIKKSDEKKFNVNGTLNNRSIAYIQETTTGDIIPQIYPAAKWISVANRQEGINKLKEGQVNAVVSDGILLVGELVMQGGNPKQFALVPKQPITTELYGCVLPKGDRTWKDFVDSVIASDANHNLQSEWFDIDQSKFPYIVRTDAR